MFLAAYFLLDYLHSVSLLLCISLSIRLYHLGLIIDLPTFPALDLNHA